MQTCLGLQKDSASMGVKINRSITTNNKWIYFLHDNKHQGQELSIVREQSVA